MKQGVLTGGDLTPLSACIGQEFGSVCCHLVKSLKDCGGSTKTLAPDCSKTTADLKLLNDSSVMVP